jgi:hypothetical protein
MYVTPHGYAHCEPLIPLLHPLPFCSHSESPPLLTWKSPFEARGVNACPHSSLVGDKLPYPCP